MHKLMVNLLRLELEFSGNFNANGRKTYAKWCVPIITYEMKIHPVSKLKTQLHCETFTEQLVILTLCLRRILSLEL